MLLSVVPLIITFSWTIRTFTSLFFFFNDTATTEIYTLSLHDALPISRHDLARVERHGAAVRVEIVERERLAVHVDQAYGGDGFQAVVQLARIPNDHNGERIPPDGPRGCGLGGQSSDAREALAVEPDVVAPEAEQFRRRHHGGDLSRRLDGEGEGPDEEILRVLELRVRD